MNRRNMLLTSVSSAVTSLFATRAQAQDVLPRREQPFKGHIGRTVEDSTGIFRWGLRRSKARQTFF